MSKEKRNTNYFANYKRCNRCNRPFRSYEDPNRCPFCKSTEYVIDLIIKEEKKDEN